MQFTAKGHLHVLLAILLTMCLQKSMAGHAQGIRLELKNETLQKAFSEITRQTGTLLLYTEEMIRDALPVTVSMPNGSLKEALDACLRHQPLEWKAINETVVITRKENKKPVTDSTRTINGIVSADGSPLAGVSIRVKGTTQGTVTGSDGTFELINIRVPATIVISSVGYQTTELLTYGANPMAVNLVMSASQLDATVIIGYGTTTKRLNTGNVGKITETEIEKQPVSNALQSLQGRIPGLNITQNTGLPGGDFKIQLRGQNSIRPEGNELLYIVDGVPFPSASLHNNFETANGAVHPLNSISPQDIQSIEILKDADATAIYGSRGANGVVLITTKKGQKGDPSLTFNFYTGAGKLARKMKLLNTTQYLEVRKEAFRNDGATPAPFTNLDLTEWDSTRNVDWQDQLLGGTAHQSNAGISYSGGSEHTQFLLGTNYYRETTVLPGNFMDEKKSVLLNINHQAFDNRLQVSFSANYLKQNARLFKRDITGYALTMMPNAPDLYDEASGKVLFPDGVNLNPYVPLHQPYRLGTDNLIANGTIKYALTRDIELSASLGYTKMHLDESSKVTLASQNVSRFPSLTASTVFGTASAETWITEPQVRWQKNIGRHLISVMTGLTFQESKRTGQSVRGSGYTSDDLLDNLLAAPETSVETDLYTRYRYSSSYSRISWTGSEKYLVNLTGRTDASSRFGPGKRVASFGAAGAGWIFSREKWIQSALPFISYGKIRGSYGVTGNDQIGDYGYLDRWVSDPYVYMNITGLHPDNLKNDHYSWETNRKWEVAIETGFLKDRITATVAWYRNRSSNQLVGYDLPATTGYTFIQDNFPATVENTGWEAEASAAIFNTAKWSWTVSGNVSFPRNKLVSFPGLETSSYQNAFRIGHTLFEEKLFHFTGLDPQTGLYTVEDVNKDGSISFSHDRLFTKAVTQKYFGALSNRIKYGQFELEFLLQFVKQDGYNYLKLFSQPGTLGNQPVAILDRWQEPGDVATHQQYTQSSSSPAYAAFKNALEQGDHAISDASFIRLKNISLNYIMTNASLKKTGLKNVTLFCRAQNLLTITDYTGMDPENQNINRLPPLKVIVAGLQLQL